MIEEALRSPAAGCGPATSSPRSDLCIAVLEYTPVSARAVACSAASRSAAASVGRAPDSSSSTGHTDEFHSSCTRSHAGVPTWSKGPFVSCLGVPVATVAINGARNAGLLAVQILAVAEPGLRDKFLEFKARLAEESRAKNRALEVEASKG